MKKFDASRRSFLKKSAMGGLLAAGISLPMAAMPKISRKITLSKGNTILFQGDSITDTGRNKEDSAFNSFRALGSGYAMLSSAALLEKYAPLDLKIYNRGISGNKVFQLAERWDRDCLDLKPDVLSILIGVNDIWHKLNGQYDGNIDVYRKDYIALLDRTLKALPDVKLIICEPFAIKGVKAVDDRWYPEFFGYQEAARQIADQFNATFIPFQKIYDEALKRAPGAYWTPDGVHASFAGAQLMANAWLEAIK